jgi:ribosome-binding protein aMBF1 (putative translation factor)|tara:strand:+ start:824 stop:1297 length:474 start_codon:yes stop_codon:yes gene_type:complete
MEIKITPPKWLISEINHMLKEQRRIDMVDNKNEEWPYGFDESKTMTEVNQEMVRRLVRSKKALDALTEAEERGLEALGDEIQEARSKLGITRQELARRTGLNESFIPLLEAGRIPLQDITQTKVLDILAPALSLSKNELLFDSLLKYTEGLFKFYLE